MRPIDGGHHEASQRAPAPRLTHQTTIHARTNSAMTVRRITIPATLSECIRAASIFRAQPCRRRFVSNGLRTRAKAYLPTGLVPRRPGSEIKDSLIAEWPWRQPSLQFNERLEPRITHARRQATVVLHPIDDFRACWKLAPDGRLPSTQSTSMPFSSMSSYGFAKRVRC